MVGKIHTAVAFDHSLRFGSHTHEFDPSQEIFDGLKGFE